MLRNIPTGHYGKYVPQLLTLCDFILIAAAIVVLPLCVDSSDFSISKAANSSIIWKQLLSIFVVLMVVAKKCYYVHANRMLRAEKMMSVLFVMALYSTVVYAAMVLFTGYATPRFLFFVLLFTSKVVVIGLWWFLSKSLLKFFRRKGRNTRNVVIVGTGRRATELNRLFAEDTNYGIHVVGHVDAVCQPTFKGPYLGSVESLSSIIETQPDIREVYYAGSLEDFELINRLVKLADSHMVHFYVVPMLYPKLQVEFGLESINSRIVAMRVHPSPLRSTFNRFIKRVFDILFSGAFLLVSPLIFIPIAIAIKCSSPGPVFFKQKRTGYRGHDFYCYKFRTMRVSADADTRQATKDDDRKTRLGDFLRRTSIDELPQFWNVFRGDMSVVGPRPHMLAHTETYRQLIDGYMVRHMVKPGITGWAQILGYRGATEELWQMEKRVSNDVWYIEHWSLLLDLKIILRTITNAVSGEENAY